MPFQHRDFFFQLQVPNANQRIMGGQKDIATIPGNRQCANIPFAARESDNFFLLLQVPYKYVIRIVATGRNRDFAIGGYRYFDHGIGVSGQHCGLLFSGQIP